MEVDITRIVRAIVPRRYSASIAEAGPTAAQDTWNAACLDALALFGDQFNRAAFDAYFKSFGAWTPAELAARTDAESAALMLQSIAGDIREVPSAARPFTREWWRDYDKACNAGQVSGNLLQGDNGTVYYPTDC